MNKTPHSFPIVLASSLASLLTVLSGCEVGPDYHPPQVQMPASFDVGAQLLPTTLPTMAKSATQKTTQTVNAMAMAASVASRTATPIDLRQWWLAFNDPELTSLIGRATVANYDINIAVERLQIARALYSAATSSELPSGGFSGGAGRGSGNNSAKGRISQPLNAGSKTTGYSEITEIAGFDANWELDLFGGFRRRAEAAYAESEAALEDRNAVLVTVLSDVARYYIALRSTQLRLKITEDNVAALRRTHDITRIALRRGIGNELNVVLAERQLSAALSRIAPLHSQIRETQRRLAVLLGLDAQALYAELDRPGPVPTQYDAVDPGLPPALIRRRPDIRRAERQLAAANARIGAATSDLFPTIALTAGFGFQGQGLGILPIQYSDLWSVGPAVRAPLLDFGRLDALVQVENYRTRAQLLVYRKTVATAVEEVDNSLNNYLAEQSRLDHLTVSVASSQRAVDLATARFDRGLTDFLNVLDAQRQLYDLQDQRASSQQTLGSQLIALFKSLGGGWESFQSLPAVPKVQPDIIAVSREVIHATSESK